VKRSIQTVPVPQNINPELKRYLEELNRQIYEVAKRQIIPFDLDMGGNNILNAGNLMQTISEVEVASDCDYVDFAGLDINRDWKYYLGVAIKNSATDSHYYLFVEDDYTETNYCNQYLSGKGADVSAVGENFPSIGWIPTGEGALSDTIIIRDPNGYFKYFSIISRKAADSTQIVAIRAGLKTAPVSNITSLRVNASVSGAIGAGSKFILARPRS